VGKKNIPLFFKAHSAPHAIAPRIEDVLAPFVLS